MLPGTKQSTLLGQQGCLEQQPAWAATLLPLVEGLLEQVAKCIAVPSVAVAMVAGRFCLRLAEFLINVLCVLRALTGEHPQVSLFLVRCCFVIR